jgi:hypothetical protein
MGKPRIALWLAWAIAASGCGGSGGTPATDAGADGTTTDGGAGDGGAGDGGANDGASQGSDGGADAENGEDATADADAAPSFDASDDVDAAECGGCAPGLICCNVLQGGTYRCVNPLNDPLDCGGCNKYCSAVTYCGAGSCVTPPCSTTCNAGLCCGNSCCPHGRICCATAMGLQCIGDITCPP